MLHLSPTTNWAWFDEAICDGACFQYISDAFPGLSEEKKTGISDRPQICQLIQDESFT